MPSTVGGTGSPAVGRSVLVARCGQLLGELDAELLELDVFAGQGRCCDAHGFTSMPGRGGCYVNEQQAPVSRAAP